MDCPHCGKPVGKSGGAAGRAPGEAWVNLTPVGWLGIPKNRTAYRLQQRRGKSGRGFLAGVGHYDPALGQFCPYITGSFDAWAAGLLNDLAASLAEVGGPPHA